MAGQRPCAIWILEYAVVYLMLSRWYLLLIANINHATIDGEGRKPIHFAAMASSIEAFDLLVQYGASPVERDEKDRTPFYLAAERGSYISVN